MVPTVLMVPWCQIWIYSHEFCRITGKNWTNTSPTGNKMAVTFHKMFTRIGNPIFLQNEKTKHLLFWLWNSSVRFLKKEIQMQISSWFKASGGSLIWGCQTCIALPITFRCCTLSDLRKAFRAAFGVDDGGEQRPFLFHSCVKARQLIRIRKPICGYMLSCMSKYFATQVTLHSFGKKLRYLRHPRTRNPRIYFLAENTTARRRSWR